MEQFEYYAPTKVLFGKHMEDRVGKEIRRLGAHKVLIHYGGSSAKKSGLLARVEALLKQEGLSYVMLGGVIANPVLSKVEEGIALCKQEQVDFILAIGGGSVIDSAKAIGYGVKNEGNLWDYYEKKKVVQDCLKIGCILTIAAAGSEMSNSSVITKEEGQLKRGLTNDLGRCKFAIMNPELTYTLSTYQSMSGAVDIMMHTLERYFLKEKPMELYDQFAYGILKTVMHHALIVKEQPENYDSRAELMWASNCSHNGMSGPREIGDWACHQLEHELSGAYGVAHGAGLSAIWGSWARYVVDEDPQRFASLARNLFDLNIEEELSCAKEGIRCMEAFFQTIQMPISIQELGIKLSDDDCQNLAYKCSFFGKRTIGCVKSLTQKDMEQIYRNAR